MTKKSSTKIGLARPQVAAPRVKPAVAAESDGRFTEVIALIDAARHSAYQAVNAELVSLCWQLGEYINRKIANAEWGDGVVEELAASLARRFPGLRGFTRPNLFRMRQFHEAYRSNRRVSAMLRQLPWTHHLIILGQAKPSATREFYILAAIKARWSSRELERQIRSGAVLREAQAAKKVSAALRQIHPDALSELKNAYNLEYALARTTSPTLVAEYQTFLPPREVLRAKLHELYAQLTPNTESDSHVARTSRARRCP